MITMGTDQHFCLRWNNFHSNIATSFEYLRDHEDFVDVTLACEGKSLKAHKVVLSACSPYFRDLLKDNPCQHPIIILRDVAFVDVCALLSFVYQGEVYVAQDRLSTFLNTAELLHIKGLTEQNHQSHNSISGSVASVFHSNSDENCLSSKKLGSLDSGQSCIVSCPRSSPSLVHNHHPPIHISPPPKKRRPTTMNCSSNNSSTSASLTPPSPPRDVSSRSDALSPRLEGSTLAAALTNPVSNTCGRVEARSCSINQTSILPTSLSNLDVPKIKQEVDDSLASEDEKPCISQVPREQAVNLVTEGSILRQRIQGFQGSADAPSLSVLSSSTGGAVCTSGMHFTGHQDDNEDSFQGHESGGDVGTDGDKDILPSPPMVIRPPLIGLLPREAPGLISGPGTSGSVTTHHDSSQGTQLMKVGRPRYAGPRDCPHCGKRYPTIAALKYHVGLVHSVFEQVPCFYCPKWFDIRTDLKRHLELAHNEHS